MKYILILLTATLLSGCTGTTNPSDLTITPPKTEQCRMFCTEEYVNLDPSLRNSFDFDSCYGNCMN